MSTEEGARLPSRVWLHAGVKQCVITLANYRSWPFEERNACIHALLRSEFCLELSFQFHGNVTAQFRAIYINWEIMTGNLGTWSIILKQQTKNNIPQYRTWSVFIFIKINSCRIRFGFRSYRRIFVSNVPLKELTSFPVVCNKGCVYLHNAETLIQDGKLF